MAKTFDFFLRMPYSDERALEQLLQTPGLTREMLVQIIITETTKNKPLRTTLQTFMAMAATRRTLLTRDTSGELAETAANESY